MAGNIPADYDTQSVGIDADESGTIVTLPSGEYYIYLVGIAIIFNDATTLTFFDGANPSTTFGPFVCPSAGTMVLDDVPGIHQAYMRTSYGNPLVIQSSNAVQISGFVRYRIM
jgi:hypothetical protein